MFTKKLYILIVLLLAGPAASASSNLYYGALRAVAQPAAGGRVYAGIENRTDTLATAMTSKLQSTETMDGEVVFYAYAQASSGWSFAGWSNRPDGAVTRTENPLAVSVACRAKNENVPTTDTVYALFRELQSTMLTLEAPTLLDGTAGGGAYTAQFSDGTNITVTDQARSHATGGTVTLTAQPAQGMKFFGWKIEPLSRPAGTLSPKRARETDANDGRWQIQATQQTAEYISYEDTLREYGFTQDCAVRAVFVPADMPLWEIKGQFGRYASLGEAVSRANTAQSNEVSRSSSNSEKEDTNDTKVIALVSSGTLHGSYTIPEGVTLLVPFDKILTCFTKWPTVTKSKNPDWAPNEEFIRLTMAPDANIDVRGTLSVSAKMRSGNGGTGCSGSVDGFYGLINMEAGSHIQLRDSAELFCWGFIIGQGSVTAENGTTVYEGFHFPLFRGGSGTSGITGSKKHVFPENQYYIHNVEVPLTLHYGAHEVIYTSVNMEDTKLYNASASFIGDDGLFQMAEGSYVVKHLDIMHDRQCYDIYGDMSLASLNLSIAGYMVNSEVFVLPITNNMDIRIHSGETTVEHQIALLAGASITIDQEATVRLKDSTYIYDKDEWLRDKFATYDYIYPTRNSPDVAFVRDTANLTDAKLDVNGTLLVDSAFYTTKGGANICSSEGTGRIVFNHVSPAADTTWQVIQDYIDIYFKPIPCTAPKLRNAERYAGTGAEYLLTGGARQLAMSNEQLAIGGVQPGDTTGVHHLPQTEASSGEPELRKGSAYPHTRKPLWGPQKTVSRGLQPGDTVYNHNGHWAWLRSFEDEASQQASLQVKESTSQRVYAAVSAHGGHHLPQTEASQINEQLAISNEQLSRSTERVVYAAVCALREEDLPELPFDTEHFIPERTISTGEPCVFLGWTDAERDEANQQIITYATWECPEEPVDAIDEVEASTNSHARKIFREGRVLILLDGREYDLLGRRIY